MPIPAPVLEAFARVRAWFRGLSRPKRVLLFATTIAAVLLVGYFSTRSAFEPYAALFHSLEREDSAAIVAKLKEQKVPYRLTADGANIEVPESRVHEARLELAGSGLPRGGGVGFESFDKMRLGATEFEQKVLYRRALEGELSRTIGTIGSVQSARVHLVMPDKSVFVSRTEPASASIVVKLRPGRSLKPGEVSSVVHLVAASVPGLEADRVALVTAEGTMLHRPKQGDKENKDGIATSDEDVPAARALESALEDRVRGMLERVVGPGHADVRATVALDVARVERTEDHFDHAKSSLRSEESSIERQVQSAPAAGVPGAESNLPGAAGAAKTAEGGGATIRESHTRNFEVDRVTEKRVTTGGQLRRLTVAVVLDGVANGAGGARTRTPEELEKIAALVRTAAGADERRGDVVTVHSMAFVDEAAVAAPAAVAAHDRLPELKKYGPWTALGLLPIGMLVWLIARKKRSRRRDEAGVPVLGPGVTSAFAMLSAAAAPDRPAELPARPEDVRAEVLERAEQDPATAALVLRDWLRAEVTAAASATETAQAS